MTHNTDRSISGKFRIKEFRNPLIGVILLCDIEDTNSKRYE